MRFYPVCFFNCLQNTCIFPLSSVLKHPYWELCESLRHEIHSAGRVSPCFHRLIRPGSRINGREIEMRSATPDRITSSMTGRLRMPVTNANGTGVASRILRASGSKTASFSGDVMNKKVRRCASSMTFQLSSTRHIPSF